MTSEGSSPSKETALEKWVRKKGAWLAKKWDRIRCLAVALLPCRFSILVLLIIFAAFTMSEQGSETLRVVVEYAPRVKRHIERSGPMFAQRLAAFGVVITAFAFQLWYCSRQALDFESQPDPLPRGVGGLRRWTPRALGALSFLAPAAGLLLAGASPSGTTTEIGMFRLMMLLISAASLFLILVVQRRVWFRLPGESPRPRKRVRTFREFPPSTRIVIYATLALAGALFVADILDPLTVSQFLGAPSVLLLCATIWVLAGAVLLYAGAYLRVPVISAFLLFALLVSPWTDNHVVEPKWRGERLHRTTLRRALLERRDRLDALDGVVEHPIYVVAAEGGGIRAAYWTAAVLSRIQDTTPGFARHCFAISGVSGGSLGAAVFARLVGDPKLASGKRTFREASSRILASDFLSPTLYRMFGTDLPKQFLPWIPLPDRGRGLELAWEDAWKRFHPGVFGESFLGLTDAQKPLLFLNGTWAETGRRIIFSPVRIDRHFENAVDGFLRIGGDIPISTAVHMSARFTYISPAASIVERGRRASLHVVDGGYFEDSGAATASDILAAIQEARIPRIAPRVIVIRYLEEGDREDRKGSQRVADSERPRRFLSEQLSPIRAMLGARTARGQFAIEELERKCVGGCAQFVLTREPDIALPLGWSLSAAARDSIDTGLARAGNVASLRRIEFDLEGMTRPEKPPDPIAADAAVSKARRREVVQDFNPLNSAREAAKAE